MRLRMIAVDDVLGRKVAIVVDEQKPAGVYEATWALPEQISSGTYVYRMQAGIFTAVRRMTVVR